MSPALYPVLDRVLAQQDLTSEVKAFVDSMESKYPVELTIFFRKGSDYAPATLKIDGIRLPKDKRGQGIGSKVMQALVDFADDHNLLCVLTPSKDFGASSVERLRRFYGQFGFNRNLGKHKDFRFSEAMIRQPKGGVKSS
jgi:GNAT superfamily N-acetyltransferase